MQPINWTQVATAAVTAAFVTLVIEYLAKPRLEARKERILERMRAHRDFLAAVITLSTAAQIVTLDIPAATDREVREAMLADKRRHYERMRTQAAKLFDDAGRHLACYPGPKREWAMRYITCVYGVTLSPRTQRQQAELIAGLAMPTAQVFDGARRKLPSRFKALGEFHRLLAEIDGQEVGWPLAGRGWRRG